MSDFLSTAHLPLHGIKVVDFGQPIAGSAVGMVLGDLGATVISIGHIGSFAGQPPYCATLNRNKLCVELDLKSSTGLMQALELIATADVVVDSFRPGVMKRLGIDYHTLCEAQPGLIAMSIPGFASNDPIRSDWKGTYFFRHLFVTTLLTLLLSHMQYTPAQHMYSYRSDYSGNCWCLY